MVSANIHRDQPDRGQGMDGLNNFLLPLVPGNSQGTVKKTMDGRNVMRTPKFFVLTLFSKFVTLYTQNHLKTHFKALWQRINQKTRT